MPAKTNPPEEKAATAADLQHAVDRILSAVDVKFDVVDTRLDGLDARLDTVDTRLDGLDTRLDGLDTRLDGLDTRLDTVDTRLDGLDTRLDGLDAEFNGVQTRWDVRFTELRELIVAMRERAADDRAHYDDMFSAVHRRFDRVEIRLDEIDRQRPAIGFDRGSEASQPT